jgi:hypothetical protein
MPLTALTANSHQRRGNGTTLEERVVAVERTRISERASVP